MIHLFDADLNGTDSINRVLESREINYIPCPTFNIFEQKVVELLPKIGPQDLVIIDTLTSLLNTTRGDAKLGTDITKSLFDVGSQKYLSGDKNFLTVYEFAAQITMRRLKNLRARQCRLIVNCHEAEVRDESWGNMKRQGPEVNPALVGVLMAASSDVFRLEHLTSPIVNPATGEVAVPIGQRVLWLRRTETFMAKFHVERSIAEHLQDGVVDPTLPKLYGILDKRPSWLTVYGHPSAGKTTFAVSELLVQSEVA